MSGNDTRLGPDDLVGRSFTIGLRGYDQDEVTAFLEQAAEAWRSSLSAAPGGGLSPSAIAALTVPDDPAVEEPRLTEVPVADADRPAAVPAPNGSGPVQDAAGDDVLRPADRALVARLRTEAERDRTTAFAERTAAELDRAGARTELAQAQERALDIIDQSQRRADAVLTNARARAQADAEAVLDEARARLVPLLEAERAARSRLARLRLELDDIGPGSPAPVLPDAHQLVTDAEDDPDAPGVSFPVGFGLVSVGPSGGGT